MLQGKNILLARFVSSQIRDHRRVFYAQMTSCAMCYDVTCHPSPINSHYLNLIPIVQFRVAGRTSHQIFIKARLGAQPSMRTWVLLICVLLLLFFIWKEEHQKLTIVEHGRTGYCTGSESCPDAMVNLKLQFWRQGTGHVTSWRSRLAGNAKKVYDIKAQCHAVLDNFQQQPRD